MVNFLYSISNNFCASIISKTLFIIVAESIDIFFPIDQLGCLRASLIDIFLKSLIGKFKNGPPEAVIIISSTLSFGVSFKSDQIEKCSESTGIKTVLCLVSFLLIKFQAHMIASLFAIAIFFVNFIMLSVGSNPSSPEIELMV